MKSVLLLLALSSSLAHSMELPNKIKCRNYGSIAKVIYEGIFNHTRIDGRSGYYTSAFMVDFTKQPAVNGVENYRIEMIGEKAFCAKHEQCAGPYGIFSGILYVTEATSANEIQLENNGSIAVINFDTDECKVKIEDVRLKRRLTKFKGEISK